MKNIFAYLLILSLSANAHAQVSRFYKDGQWWVSWDSKDAQVQVFTPVKNAIPDTKGRAITANATISTWTTLIIDTASTISKYKAECKGKSFDRIKDSVFNAVNRSYFITFDNGTGVESKLVSANTTPAPPWATEREWFSDHLMFHVMYACYDDT